MRWALLGSLLLLVTSTGCAESSAIATCNAQTLAQDCAPGEVCVDGSCVPSSDGPIGDLGRYTRLALLSDGRSVVATYDTTHRNLVLVTESATGAQQSRIIDGFVDGGQATADAGKWPNIAIGTDDSVHLSWYDATRGQLKYTRATDANAAIEVVDGAAADTGTHGDIALGDDGIVRVAYRDTTSRSLRLATRLNGVWNTETVPPCTLDDENCPDVSNYGEYNQLFVSGGSTRIVFYDRGRGALRIAERAGDEAPWLLSTIDGDAPGTDVGRFAAAAMDALGRLGIAYFDAGRGALRFYYEADGGGGPLVADSGSYSHESSQTTRRSLVGQHPAIVFDRKNHAVVVYLDATELSLKLVRIAGSAVVERTTLSLPAGGHLSLAKVPTAYDGKALPIAGAYGAWLSGAAPRTMLQRFSVPWEGTP